MKHAIKWLNYALRDRETEMERLQSIPNYHQQLVDTFSVQKVLADEIFEIKQEIKQLETL